MLLLLRARGLFVDLLSFVVPRQTLLIALIFKIWKEKLDNISIVTFQSLKMDNISRDVFLFTKTYWLNEYDSHCNHTEKVLGLV
jgi:hypothetical protein